MMIKELAGGEILSGVKEDHKRVFKELEIDCTLAKINSYMGVELSKETVDKILNNMGFKYEFKDGNYHVTVPSRRIDYENNYQDLIEDIARFYGYDNIPLTIPKTSDVGHLTKEQLYERGIKNLLATLGMNEVITYSLTSEAKVNQFNYHNYEAIKVLIPITEEKQYLRLSLIPSLLEVLAYNKARKKDNMSIFEMANLYAAQGEYQYLTGAFSGIGKKSLWQKQEVDVDFYYAKGVLDEMFKRMGLSATYVKDRELKNLHPGVSAKIMIGEEEIGFIGQIHPNMEKEYSLNKTFVFELDMAKLLHASDDRVNYHLFSKYPSITRDLAIVLDKSVEAYQVEALIRQTARKYLVNIELFDLYEDPSLGENKKQLAYKLTFADNSKTLESEEVDKVIKSVLNRLAFNFGATLRE